MSKKLVAYFSASGIFTESQIARSQYLTIICSEIFQYFRIGADHFALIHSCPPDVKSWTTFFTNKFEKAQKNKPHKAFNRFCEPI